MRAIEFEDQNIILGKDQEEYNDLPACFHQDNVGSMTTCWELTEEEKEEFNRTGKIYLTQLTFGNPFQPVRMDAKNPFKPQAAE